MLEPCTKQGRFSRGPIFYRKEDEQLGQDAFSAELPEVSKGCFQASLENKFGSHGAASAVRRIDPKTGKVIEEIRSADDIRRSLGPELAARL